MDSITSVEFSMEFDNNEFASVSHEFPQKNGPEQKVVNELYEALLPLIIESWVEETPSKKTRFKTASSAVSVDDPDPLYNFDIKFTNGNRYNGEIKDKRLHGEGVYRWADGAYYKGELHVVIMKEGAIGTFMDNRIEGTGSIFYNAGQRYSGQVSYGYHHGSGLLVTESMTYGGEFNGGILHGEGHLESKIGTFDGVFVDDRIFEGTRVYEDGVFTGRFDLNGERLYGRFVLNNGDVYIGNWQQDHYCDFGIYRWNVYDAVNRKPNKFIVPRENCFIGHWVDSYRFGSGVLYFDERVILSLWKFDFKVGAGVIITANGDIFVSENMYANSEYREGFKVRNNHQADESIRLLKKFIKMNDMWDLVNFTSSNFNFADAVEWIKPLQFEPTLLNEVKFLMQFSELSDQPPLFLPKYMVNTKDTPIVDFMEEFFPDVERETLEEVEIKSLNQVITSNYKLLENMYDKFSRYGRKVDAPTPMFLIRVGLWRFLKMINFFNSTFKIFEFLYNTEHTFHLLSEDLTDPYEKIYFWQFLKYILALTLWLNQDRTVADDAMKERLPYFGLFGTMLMIFLREYPALDSMPVDNLPQMLTTDLAVVEHVFDSIMQYPPQCILRKSYSLFQDLCVKLNPNRKSPDYLAFEDFVQCVAEECPSVVRDGLLVHIDEVLTTLELFELFILFVSKAIRNEKYLIEKQKFLNTFYEEIQKQKELEELERLLELVENPPQEETKKKKRKSKK